MDCEKMGALIRALRQEKQLTQRQLAGLLHVSEQAVSKWETGMGCPDISLLPPLSSALGTPVEALLQGALPVQEERGGNMRKTKFYVCPVCGNVITSAAEASIACCGKSLSPLTAQKPSGEEDLAIQPVEDEYFITTAHEMTKEHYIPFVALVTGERVILSRHYPEWNLETRLPRRGLGMLIWYCNQHGLFQKILK